MFRIKTDIRQYKCETKNKVEKLIRNWVIRPNDLIYSTDHKEWLPIGEHPAFMRLFGMLEEQEKNTPDTVVSRSPYSQRAPVSDGEVPRAEPLVEEEEVTQLVERPQFDDESDGESSDEDSDGAAISGDAFDLEEEAPDGQPDEAAGEEPEPGDDEDQVAADEGRPEGDEDDRDDESVQTPEDARKTDVFDQEEISRSISETDDSSESEPAPPEAPEGVEPPSNDEVTMMTDRTLEMLKITDESEAAEDTDDDEEEITDVRDRKGVSESDEADDSEEEHEPNVIVEDQTKSNGVSKKSKKRLGRHDLPEELFATNEISSPEVRDKIAKLDELRELKELSELSEPSEPTIPKAKAQKGEGNGANGGESWDVRLQEDSGVDEAWEEIADDLRTTEDISGEPAAGELRETDEIERDETSLEQPSDSEELPHHDEVNEAEDGESEDESPDDENLEEVELDEEWDDTAEPLVPGDFVSDGYKIPLPFPIRPTGDDIRRGLRSTKTSRSRKDRTYPLPQPKKLDEVHRRTFDLTPRPPRDQTVLLAVGVLVLIAIISVVVTSC